MRVLLTLPPDIHDLEIYRITGMNAPPLGLAWIAAVLEENGHKVRILDTPTLKIGMNEFITKVKEWKPDVVGISLQTPTAPRGYKAIATLKELLPDVPIIVGGVHPTFMYEEALNQGADVVVRYEGEYTTLELLNTIERYGLDEERLKRIEGIAFIWGSVSDFNSFLTTRVLYRLSDTDVVDFYLALGGMVHFSSHDTPEGNGSLWYCQRQQ